MTKLALIGVALLTVASLVVGCAKKPLETGGRQTSDPTMTPPKAKADLQAGKTPAGAKAAQEEGAAETPAKGEGE